MSATEARAAADHGEWGIRIYDDQPVPEGKTYAPDTRVIVLRHGNEVRSFLYPSYRIWTLLAHWTEGLDELAEVLDATPCEHDTLGCGARFRHDEHTKTGDGRPCCGWPPRCS